MGIKSGFQRRWVPVLARGVLLMGLAWVAPRDVSGQEGSDRIQPPTAPGWLAGCWLRTGGGSVYEEQWMLPAGGMMVGMSRTLRNGQAVGWEHLEILSAGGELVYVAYPSSQSRTEFPSVLVTDTLVVFENPAHDFPQRILYRSLGPDSLLARIEGEAEGQVRGVDFPLGRRACPGGSPALSTSSSAGTSSG